jgi:dTDP-4-amino-4,6-dideoxygalactose transaminase
MKNIPFSRILFNTLEINKLKKILKNQNSIYDSVNEFENNIKNFLNVDYAISTSNETQALHLALSAISLKRGDKVLMSVNSFVNIPEVVRHFDAEPIFVDINSYDMNIDLDKFEYILSQNISKKLRVAIISFIDGNLPDLNRIYRIAKKYNIILIEDATHFFGAKFDGKLIGSLGDSITIFSTIPSNNKVPVTTNGFIVTNNKNIASRAFNLRTNGLNTTYDNGNMDHIYDVIDIGYKYDITILDSFLGLCYLEKTNSIIKRRKEIASIYSKRLMNIEDIDISHNLDFNNNIFSQYIIKITKHRDIFSNVLRTKGIFTGLHYIPLHLMSYYRNKYHFKVNDYPNALNSYQKILSLPIYESLTNEDVEYICDCIVDISKSWE